MTEPASATPGAVRATVSLADEEGVKRILVDTILGLWSIVNDLTRLRPSKRERYRVTIFGSARAEPGSFVYDEVKRVAAALGQLGCDIVTGGGPGLMQAANEGAAAGLVNPEDLTIPRCVATADEAIAAIREHHTRWLRDRDGLGAPTSARDGG